MIDRIKQVMNHYGFTSTQFADRIGAQRSAMSHVLSGRNKPSLEFVLKIKHAFPQLSLDWLLLGKGGMFTSAIEEGIPRQTALSFDGADDTAKESSILSDNPAKKPQEAADMAKHEEAPVYETKPSTGAALHGTLEPEWIVFYYPDGTFKGYRPQ